MNEEDIEIGFPKKRTALKKDPVLGIQEPKRITAYDIICKNLQLAGRTTFLHRLVYTGYHNFPCFDSYEETITLFSSTINKPNQQDRGFEKLTGFLVLYPKYFIHLIEGDEDNIHLHLNHLMRLESYNQRFGQVKLLTMVANINRRLIDDWGYYFGSPPTLSEIVDSPDFSIMELTISCILKLYALINHIVVDYNGTSTMSSGRLNSAYEIQRDMTGSSKSILDAPSLLHGVGIGTGKLCRLNKEHNYGSNLPECKLLDYIIESNWTIDLKEYFGKSRTLPQRNLEKDIVWPVPSDFIPLDVFDKVYDRITELPKLMKTEIEENNFNDNIKKEHCIRS